MDFIDWADIRINIDGLVKNPILASLEPLNH